MLPRYLAPVLRVLALPTLFVGFAAVSCRDFSPRDAARPIVVKATPIPPMVPLSRDTIFTATNEVRALATIGNTLWAATAGGVLRYENGRWTKWNRQAGFPSHEAQNLWHDAKGLHLRFPVQEVVMKRGKLKVQDAKPSPHTEPQAVWRGTTWKATLTALESPQRKVPLPTQSTGTHISALLASPKALVVAMYGDGLWRWNGTWARDGRNTGLPVAAREITALAGDDKTLWLGTRRSGVFRWSGDKWNPLPRADEPRSANIQNIALYHGVLWASTLEDGLVFRGGKGWGQIAPPKLSSNAPRHLVEFQDRLYIRHGTGIVDAYDSHGWEKNALKSIPRRGVYALDADNKTLFCAGWGGWSEWDGQKWTAHYEIPALKGVPLVGIAVAGDDLWLATQSRGVGRYHRTSGEFRFYDERDALPDDWITSILVNGKTVWAGTFVGGLVRFDGTNWETVPELKGLNVTSIVKDGQGGVYAATRHGLWRVSTAGTAQKVDPAWLDSEQQALLATSQGLWVGTRTSLNFWRPSLPSASKSVDTVASTDETAVPASE